jgi:site-specific DNA recombinase
MNCALYIRVSTTEQAEEGFSISAQKHRLISYADSQDWNIVGVYPDEGRSAKDTNRPELKRLIGDIKKGMIDVVLVYKLDRLTRSVLDLYELLKIFEKHNCKFKSATEVYDTTTAIGRLFLTLVAALAQWERENLAERVRFGMREKVRQGQWHGSKPPYGFEIENGRLIIKQDEADVLEKMFTMYVYQGLSDRKVAISLNQMGIRTQNGALWNEAKVRYKLTNPVAVGKLRLGVRVNKENKFEVEDAAPQVIDMETFETAQKLRKARNLLHGKQATSSYIFSGILRCARCGSPVKGVASINKYGVKYKRYRCTGALYHRCDMQGFSEWMIEDQFINWFKTMHLIDEVKGEIASSDQSNDDKHKKIKRLKKELQQIESRRKKWQYAWANVKISDEDFAKRMKEESDKEEIVKRDLSEMEENKPNEISDTAINELSGYIDNWSSLSDGEKKQLVQIIVKKIIVDHTEARKKSDRVVIKQIEFN